MDEQPKCVRLVVTAMYADGSSQMYDIKDPESTSITLDRLEPGYFPPEVTAKRATKVVLEVNAIVDGKSPCYVSTHPVPKDDGLEGRTIDRNEKRYLLTDPIPAIDRCRIMETRHCLSEACPEGACARFEVD